MSASAASAWLLREPLEEGALTLLTELSAIDRYQASDGAERAAELIAADAEAAGLRDVEVLYLPGDGERRWWSFEAPLAWTPVAATLDVGTTTSGPRRVASHAEQALSLATYSKPPAGGAVRAPLIPASAEPHAWRDRVVVGTGDDTPTSAFAERVEDARALGFVTCVGNSDAVRRIELDPHARIFGFSVGRTVLSDLCELLPAGPDAVVAADVRSSGRMPLVTGLLPGTGRDEVLLQAHLCHPRPGANDNASGAVAAVGVIRGLNRLQARVGRPVPSVRALWAPEIVGTAAYLHDLVAPGRLPRPIAVINLDMVGGDPAKCGAVTFVERPPWPARTELETAITRNFAAVAAHVRAAGHDWSWTRRPFRGASDHGLFADPTVGCPAVHVGQWPDRFNHSSDDTCEKVSPEQIARVVAGVTAAIHELPASRHPRPGRVGTAAPSDEGERFVRRWSGPFNLRALLASLGPDTRQRLAAAYGSDRLWSYGAMQSLAYTIDGATGRHGISAAAGQGLGAPVPARFVDLFLDAMLEAGWIDSSSA